MAAVGFPKANVIALQITERLQGTVQLRVDHLSQADEVSDTFKGKFSSVEIENRLQGLFIRFFDAEKVIDTTLKNFRGKDQFQISIIDSKNSLLFSVSTLPNGAPFQSVKYQIS